MDTDQQTTALACAYRTGSHHFGFDADYFERPPDGAADSAAWRLGVFYTLDLQRPPVVTAAAAPAAPGADLPTMTELAPRAKSMKIESTFIVHCALTAGSESKSQLKGGYTYQHLALVGRSQPCASNSTAPF